MIDFRHKTTARYTVTSMTTHPYIVKVIESKNVRTTSLTINPLAVTVFYVEYIVLPVHHTRLTVPHRLIPGGSPQWTTSTIHMYPWRCPRRPFKIVIVNNPVGITYEKYTIRPQTIPEFAASHTDV